MQFAEYTVEQEHVWSRYGNRHLQREPKVIMTKRVTEQPNVRSYSRGKNATVRVKSVQTGLRTLTEETTGISQLGPQSALEYHCLDYFRD